MTKTIPTTIGILIVLLIAGDNKRLKSGDYIVSIVDGAII